MRGRRALIVCFALWWGARVFAHSGPPYPIITNHPAGAYRVSVWTDPDATNDGSPGGQFWVVIDREGKGDVAEDVRARITVRPLDRQGPPQTAQAMAEDGNWSRQFAAVLMDHEGPFAVGIEIESGAGRVSLESRVDATYDLRPSRVVLALYALPFVAVGLLWVKLLVTRRVHRRSVA